MRMDIYIYIYAYVECILTYIEYIQYETISEHSLYLLYTIKIYNILNGIIHI